MIRVRDVVMRLPSGGRPLTILDGVTLDVAAGELCAVTGPSGSGKSTLLGLIAGLDRPSAGSITVAGVEITGLDEDALARFRRDTLGYVFQSYHLIPTLTAAENVAVPLEIAGALDALARARALLADVGLGERTHHYPVQLSGGEQQRVALARPVAPHPRLRLAPPPPPPRHTLRPSGGGAPGGGAPPGGGRRPAPRGRGGPRGACAPGGAGGRGAPGAPRVRPPRGGARAPRRPPPLRRALRL